MKPRTYKFNTLLVIEWLDIVDDNSWLSFQKASSFQASSCKSVGYFLNRDDTVIRISASVGIKDTKRSALIIPWGCINKIETK